MPQGPIDLTRLLVRALRLADDGRRAAEDAWKRVTANDKDAPTGDRHRPPQIW